MSKREIERYAKKKSDMQLEIEDLEMQRAVIIEKKNATGGITPTGAYSD
jgi:protein involved in sex pheromone biosynthesis